MLPNNSEVMQQDTNLPITILLIRSLKLEKISLMVIDIPHWDKPNKKKIDESLACMAQVSD